MNTANTGEKFNGHGFVDLGLPSGTLWADRNIGADSPEQTGLYFPWGDTVGFTAEQLEAGKTKLNDSPKEIKGNLSLKDDAAHVIMGGKWFMPTKIDFKELVENTSHEKKNINGTDCFMFTSNNNGNSLILPISSYWSSSMAGQKAAWMLTCHNGKYGDMVGVEFNFRSKRFSVRGVCNG